MPMTSVVCVLMASLQNLCIELEPTAYSPLHQLVEQRPGLLQVSGVKPLSEPAVDGRQQRVGLGALALALPQARQAHGGAQFQGFRLLTEREVEGLTETSLSL